LNLPCFNRLSIFSSDLSIFSIFSLTSVFCFFSSNHFAILIFSPGLGISYSGIYGLISKIGVSFTKSQFLTEIFPFSKSIFSIFTNVKPIGLGRYGARDAKIPTFFPSPRGGATFDFRPLLPEKFNYFQHVKFSYVKFWLIFKKKYCNKTPFRLNYRMILNYNSIQKINLLSEIVFEHDQHFFLGYFMSSLCAKIGEVGFYTS
jgi:hypothetical protein